VDTASGKTSDIAAAILKILKFFIVGSICAVEANPFEGRTFPRVSRACQSGSVRGMNGLRLFRDNPPPLREGACRRFDGGGLNWTIPLVNGIQNADPFSNCILEPARP
jgi:hypothetical protein